MKCRLLSLLKKSIDVRTDGSYTCNDVSSPYESFVFFFQDPVWGGLTGNRTVAPLAVGGKAWCSYSETNRDEACKFECRISTRGVGLRTDTAHPSDKLSRSRVTLAASLHVSQWALPPYPLHADGIFWPNKLLNLPSRVILVVNVLCGS
jgi:hypothetical protein